MNVIAVACVRDESDIIEAFVRHNLAQVTRLIVLDNGSGDGTLEILNSLKEEGLHLDIHHDPSPGKYLSQRMTRLMREYAIGRHDADWVLPLDADELVSIRENGSLVPDAADADKPLELPWRSYLPDSGDDPTELNPVVRIRRRIAEETNPLVKVFVPAHLGRRADAVLLQGNHELSVDGRPCNSVRHHGACLAHFPVRSRGQFVAKTVLGHLQNLAKAFHDPRAGVPHRDYFEMLQHDSSVFSDDFPAWLRSHAVHQFASSPHTVADPLIYRGGALRYTPKLDETAQCWQPVLNYAQDLARRYGLLRASLTEEQQLSLEQQLDIFTYFREQLDGRERTLTQHQQKLQAAEARNRSLERELDAADRRRADRELRNSWTWKVGRMALWPARLLRRGWRRSRRAVARPMPANTKENGICAMRGVRASPSAEL
jgi:glycosyltransferase involved in cell wall biosynthesis